MTNLGPKQTKFVTGRTLSRPNMPFAEAMTLPRKRGRFSFAPAKP